MLYLRESLIIEVCQGKNVNRFQITYAHYVEGRI
jgi:hypothetical protein